jgi:hypothetical protein
MLSDKSSWPPHGTPVYIQYNTRNSSDRTTETAGIHRVPLAGARFVTQQAQSAEHELHTLGGKGGRGHRRDTRQHFNTIQDIQVIAPPKLQV